MVILRFRIDSGDEILRQNSYTCGGNASYTSPDIQNQIIDACKEVILQQIVNRINASECFSILANETTDVKGIEQLSLCARYVNNTESVYVIRENFVRFVPVHDVRGSALASTIPTTLKNVDLNLDYLYYQGYDGAASMSGRLQGCQSVIRQSYPTAVNVYCANHSLNLALTQACSLPEIRNYIGTVKEVV
ncbi:hypothetical protein PR048_001576 [Dryococelus australis]|uniref:DUF4371 domain-containing protein n=1 Tax=Dryococelus australis TaxID=614101 RepID=A0ABQ9IHR4_9NEOP|nr:hypothetical protein PR048_001576 [Dryococelus australis]